jgi:hypothetical protein
LKIKIIKLSNDIISLTKTLSKLTANDDTEKEYVDDDSDDVSSAIDDEKVLKISQPKIKISEKVIN